MILMLPDDDDDDPKGQNQAGEETRFPKPTQEFPVGEFIQNVEQHPVLIPEDKLYSHLMHYQTQWERFLEAKTKESERKKSRRDAVSYAGFTLAFLTATLTSDFEDVILSGGTWNTIFFGGIFFFLALTLGAIRSSWRIRKQVDARRPMMAQELLKRIERDSRPGHSPDS